MRFENFNLFYVYIRFCMTRCIQLPYLFCYRYCLCFLGFYLFILFIFTFALLNRNPHLMESSNKSG